MKIKKEFKPIFYFGLLYLVQIACNLYRVISYDFSTGELIMNLLGLVVVIDCFIRCVEKK